jgi:hypothetical protein
LQAFPFQYLGSIYQATPLELAAAYGKTLKDAAGTSYMEAALNYDNLKEIYLNMAFQPIIAGPSQLSLISTWFSQIVAPAGGINTKASITINYDEQQ